MLLSEEEVYNGAKRWLRKNGYIVLAGQPARGVDHLPVIEIKQPTGDKGSKFAYKPDLVAFKDNKFYIIECKPGFDKGDLLKVTEVLNSPERLYSFYNELEQYQLLRKINYTGGYNAFCTSVVGILAHSEKGLPCSLQQLKIEDWKGKAILIPSNTATSSVQ